MEKPPPSASPPVLDYRTAPDSLSAGVVRRFLIIYGAGIVAMFATVFLAVQLTSNSPNRDYVGIAIMHAVGAGACVWLVLALVRILQYDAIRRSRWTWWLFVVNLFLCTGIIPGA